MQSMELIKEGDRVMVGFSGGKDSTLTSHLQQNEKSPFKFDFRSCN